MVDEHTEERVNEGIREYFNVMKNNSKYTSFMAKFTSYLVKLCNINRNVAELLSSCPEEWDWVIDWIKSNPVTSKSGGQSQQFSKHTREIAASQYKVRRLNDIKNGNIEMHDDEYDSDEDMSNHKFQKEEKIDYMVYTNNYVTAEVVTALDELINIQFIAYNQNKSHWVPVDNEGFAPYLSMQNRHDLKLIEDIRADVEKNIRKTMQQHHQEESGSAQVMSDDRYSHEANENDSVSDEN